MKLHVPDVIFIVSLTHYISVSYCQDGATTKAAKCNTATTCQQCMSKGPDCAWCNLQGYTDYRCSTLESHNNTNCPQESIEYPLKNITIIKNILPNDGNASNVAVQLSPQEVNIKLRPYEPVTIDVSFRLAKNYPVDLYYLMDHSNSMRDDKEKVTLLSNRLVKALEKITSNLQMGFGTFVDKVTTPYVSLVPKYLKEPCTGCAAPYGYINQLSLTRKTSLFAERVNSTKISSNLDAPEGGFDAIMQAVVCKNAIGWRDKSRKILLFSSDATFHFAGDGKLGGIVKPNDGLCHLDDNGVYNMSLYQDYPSVGHIGDVISQNNVNLIFAVTKYNNPLYPNSVYRGEPYNTYIALGKLLEGAVVGELADDSANVVDLVRNNYDKISSKIELVAENTEDVTVTFQSNCSTNTLKQTNVCDQLKIGETVTYRMTVQVDKCLTGGSRTITVKPVGLSEELRINLDVSCDCQCNAPASKEVDSPYCSSGNGTYSCGICECNDGRLGDLCECDSTSVNLDNEEASCIRSDSDSVCSGRGSCICGKCDCISRSQNSKQKFSGKFCECDDYSCGYHNGELCGGARHGKCTCGQCQCNLGYGGERCECPTDETPCLAKNGEQCNGVGQCVCNANTDYKKQCRCTDDKYSGPTCEQCLTCGNQCDDYKDCVQCRLFGTGLEKDKCVADCNHLNMTTLNSVSETSQARFCPYVDSSDDCEFFFTYEYTSGNSLELKAQKTKRCPKPINILAIILGIVGGILALGIALLIVWKVLTTIHDKREYAKFEEERLNARWQQDKNPLYKEATSRYKNPMYNKE